MMSLRPRWTTLVPVIPLMLAACAQLTTPSITPAGTVLGQQALWSYWPSDSRSSLATLRPDVAERTFELGTDGRTKGKVVFEHLTAPDGSGRFLKSVRVEVIQNVEYTLRLGEFGSVTNAGSSQRMNMMLPFTVTYRSTEGESHGKAKFKLFADGRLLGR